MILEVKDVGIYDPKEVTYMRTDWNGDNCIIKHSKCPNVLLRGRLEVLILSEDLTKVLICPAKSGTNYEFFGYRLPGGSFERGKRRVEVAEQEAAEEARMVIADVENSGLAYIYTYDKPSKWVIEKIPEENWWYGSYVEVFVAKYVKPYEGRVEEIHADADMVENAIWVDLSYDKLIKRHRIAIREYLKVYGKVSG